MVTIGVSRRHYFPLPRRPHIHLAAHRRHHIRIAFFHSRFLGQRACIRGLGARLVHCLRRNVRQQLVRPRLPQIRLRCRKILPSRIHRRLRRL